MTADTTYGTAITLAAAVEENDSDTLQFVFKNIDLGTIAASTLQLSHLILHILPRGAWNGGYNVDIREEAFSHFANLLSSRTLEMSARIGADPQDVNTAISTIIMGTLVPILESKEGLSISPEQEGIDDYGLFFLVSYIAYAAIDTFSAYAPIVDDFPYIQEGNHAQARDHLSKILSVLAIRQAMQNQAS